LWCCSFTEVRKEACFILGLLAVKPEYQHQIATAQALPGLVKLLQVRLGALRQLLAHAVCVSQASSVHKLQSVVQLVLHTQLACAS
jgi:hypothetical protein